MITLNSLTSIVLISDTHGLLRPEVLPYLEQADIILHAGDVGKATILEALRAIKPTYCVRGNVDKGPWAQEIPLEQAIRLNSQTFYMRHIRAEIDLRPPLPDWVIFGHSHKPLLEKEGSTHWLNPGSIGPRRFNLPVSMAMLRWEKEHWQSEFIYLAR